MPIRLETLRQAATRPSYARLAKSLVEARKSQQQTAFLCHSHQDVRLATGLQSYLAEQGWQGYIDSQDADMPPSPNRETAERIKRKIDELDWFLFLATVNSVASRWCPWEIGYADSRMANRIVLIRTEDDQGRHHGNEYLQLYRELEYAGGGRLAVFPAGSTQGGVLLTNLR